jgi:hypothetical protein
MRVYAVTTATERFMQAPVLALGIWGGNVLSASCMLGYLGRRLNRLVADHEPWNAAALEEACGKSCKLSVQG